MLDYIANLIREGSTFVVRINGSGFPHGVYSIDNVGIVLDSESGGVVCKSWSAITELLIEVS